MDIYIQSIKNISQFYLCTFTPHSALETSKFLGEVCLSWQLNT